VINFLWVQNWREQSPLLVRAIRSEEGREEISKSPNEILAFLNPMAPPFLAFFRPPTQFFFVWLLPTWPVSTPVFIPNLFWRPPTFSQEPPTFLTNFTVQPFLKTPQPTLTPTHFSSWFYPPIRFSPRFYSHTQFYPWFSLSFFPDFIPQLFLETPTFSWDPQPFCPILSPTFL